MRMADPLAPHGLSLTFDFPCVRFWGPFGQNKTLQEMPTPTSWAAWNFYHRTPSAAYFGEQGIYLSWARKKIWYVYFFPPLIQTWLIGNIGGIVHLKCFGKHFILLNDFQMAVDILDKRGSNYSGRPLFPIHERYSEFELLCRHFLIRPISAGFVQATPLMDYGNDHQVHRKMLQKYFNTGRTSLHRPIQTREGRVLVQNLISKPDNREELLIRSISCFPSYWKDPLPSISSQSGLQPPSSSRSLMGM